MCSSWLPLLGRSGAQVRFFSLSFGFPRSNWVCIWAYGVLLPPCFAAGTGSFGVGAESNGASSSFRLVAQILRISFCY